MIRHHADATGDALMWAILAEPDNVGLRLI